MQNYKNKQDIINETKSMLSIYDNQNEIDYFDDVSAESWEFYMRDTLKSYEPKPREDFRFVYQSREYIPLQRMINIRKMLSFIKYKYQVNDEQSTRINKNYIVIDKILNSLEERGTEFVTGTASISGSKILLVNKVKYGYTKNHRYGRLYGETVSINKISREFRAEMFKTIYQDIDMVNSHPTILYKFGLEHNLDIPALEQLVNDRDTFYKTMHNQYTKRIDSEFADNLNLKQLALAVLNNKKKVKYVIDILTQLVSDITLIRQRLRIELDVPGTEFHSAINYRMIEIKSKCPIERLSKIQSLYCYSEETTTIMDFKRFFLEKTGDNDSIVPFFDGLFIKTNEMLVETNSGNLNAKRMYDLKSIINEYNATSKYKFALKPIKPKYRFVTENSLTDFESLLAKVNNLTDIELEELISSNDIIHNDSFKSVLDNHFPEKPKRFKEVSFTFECLADLKDQASLAYNKLIDCVYDKSKPLIMSSVLASNKDKKNSKKKK